MSWLAKRSGWQVSILAILCGLWLGLIHPPYHLPWLGILGLPAAYVLAASTQRPYRVGYFFGLGFFLITMSWIREPFLIGPPSYRLLGLPAWGLMAAGLALFWLPIFRFMRHGAWAVAFIFALMEWLRGWVLTGLPWGYISYGFVDTPIAQNAALIGSFALSGWIALAVLYAGGLDNRKRWIGFVCLLALFVFPLLRGAPQNQTLAEFRVNIVQGNIPQSMRFDPTSQQLHLDKQIGLSDSNADLVIWPESSTAFSPSVDPGIHKFLFDRINAPLIYGAPSFDDGQYFNSAYLVQGEGEIYRYDKTHLVPFGEYIPMGNWMRSNGILVNTVAQFSMQKGQPRPWVGGALPQPNILICYEGIFPKLARRNGEYLVLITNDDWFGTRSGPQQHLVSARFRAIEVGLPMARAAVTGISAIIDANGRVLGEIPLREAGSITLPLGAKYDVTPYAKWQDWPFYLLMLMGWVGLLWKHRLGQKSPS